MRLTARDFEILHTLYRYDNILSVDQVHRWFFGVKRRAYYRISAFYQHHLVQRLKVKELYRVPEPILWLDKAGIVALADYLGVEYADFHWRTQPHFSRVSHDLALNEFRYRLEQAFKQDSRYDLEIWQGQDELERLLPDPLPYLDSSGEQASKRIRPDGYLCVKVLDEQPYRLRFFVELDNNTESSRRFGRDKVSPSVHFLRSEMYTRELGGKTGRFLVVTVGSAERFHNLRSEVTAFGGAGYFLFTRSEEWLTSSQVLDAPLLYLSYGKESFSFATYQTPEFQARVQQTVEKLPQVKLLY